MSDVSSPVVTGHAELLLTGKCCCGVVVNGFLVTASLALAKLFPNDQIFVLAHQQQCLCAASNNLLRYSVMHSSPGPRQSSSHQSTSYWLHNGKLAGVLAFSAHFHASIDKLDQTSVQAEKLPIGARQDLEALPPVGSARVISTYHAA
ncbi:hypothetical protein AC578_10070 [Pseudocercospora eumusae]|uniref:Uncharacterized protein n=1 Tax=Pseudocercospora eumusae TaxID=321146 RepID=A0A139H869_9PEZI|nr:hypothetical protein AC578_10070 [Pseudocercospora eumusae]